MKNTFALAAIEQQMLKISLFHLHIRPRHHLPQRRIQLLFVRNAFLLLQERIIRLGTLHQEHRIIEISSFLPRQQRA